MNVNFVTPRPIWPVRGGDAVRAEQIVLSLSRFVSDPINLYVLTGEQDPDSIPPEVRGRLNIVSVPHKPTDRFAIIKFALIGKPLQYGLFFNANAKRLLNRAAREDDAIFVLHTIRAFSVLPKMLSPSRVALDLCDSLSMTYDRLVKDKKQPLLRRVVYLLEGRRLAVAERAVRTRADWRVVISPKDAEAIGDSGLQIIENWVDFSAAIQDRIADTARQGPLLGVMVGNFRTVQNREGAALLHAWTRSLRERDLIKIRLWGRNADMLSGFAGPNFEIAGEYVDAETVFRPSDVSFCLTRVSGGMQNKVIQASAYGVPSIILPNVSESATYLQDGVSCIVVNSAAEIEQVLQNHSRTDFFHLGSTARRLVGREFGRIAIEKKWGAIFKSMIAGAKF